MADNVTLIKCHLKRWIPRDILKDKVKEIAEAINKECEGKFLELIVVLKGAFIFAADLIRYLKVDHSIHFVQFSSYKGTKSQDKIIEKIPITFKVKGKNILIIEDIIDTGNTLNYFIEKLKKQEPDSLNVAVLLFKPNAFRHEFPIKFKAFELDNQSVIGYGMDLDERARN